MGLPVVATPTFELTLPSTKQKIRYRPFLVKEEKILLFAMESGEESDVINAVHDILKSCVLTDGIKFEKLPSFDVEYMFLNLRAKSVGEVVDLKYRHTDNINKAGNKCEHVQDISVNLESINVTIPDDFTNKIMINDTIGVIVNYPTIDVAQKVKNITNEVEKTFAVISLCISTVWEGDDVYDEFTDKELEEFIGGFSKEQFAKLTKFFEDMPKLSHTVNYKCKGCGEDTEIVIEGLQNFFT